MSQVIVTNDNLNKEREFTRQQEHKISKEAMYQRWRLANVNQMRPLAVLIGLASVPVVFFWGFLLLLMGASLSIFIGILKVLGQFVRSKKT
jgi:hypothetical protein